MGSFMRITQEAKLATEQRILETAARLFASSGWDSATTREIAAGAGIATGTLFNYFPCKEGIAAALISNAFERAEQEFTLGPRQDATLEEDLFALIWTGLKSLREYRTFLAPAAETIFSPLARSSTNRTGDAIRVRHLELVEEVTAAHGGNRPLPAVSLQLYWTLYLGVLAYWSADPSPNQEDTLALLDHSLKLFIASLDRKGEDHDQRKPE
jgi:AcrR family transcriptional regulator